jgi:hypothetical protein
MLWDFRYLDHRHTLTSFDNAASALYPAPTHKPGGETVQDDKTMTRPWDASQISLKELYEVNWWCDRFECTKAQLEAAVKAVGHSTSSVEDYLKNNPPGR